MFNRKETEAIAVLVFIALCGFACHGCSYSVYSKEKLTQIKCNEYMKGFEGGWNECKKHYKKQIEFNRNMTKR